MSRDADTPLGREIRALIAVEGPITVARYMALCLGHPQHGYYMTRDPFGAGGDFVTAPEVSQMFGELIGLWCADLWQRMGQPAALALVELGPGRGTLMADALRAARALPAFRNALSIHLVETSPVLRERQARTLEGCGLPLAWHGDVSELPAGPCVVIANEFFDALPVRQYVARGGRWHERLVGLTPDDRGLAFGLAPDAHPGITRGAPDGAVIEVAEAGEAIAGALAGRIARDGGALLSIDYGHVRTDFGDTLQALRRHAFVDPLSEPGEADVTAHVDFEALARAASAAGGVVHGPTTQGAFLTALGLDQRAAILARSASDGGAAQRAAVARLAGPGPDGMGDLFKVLAVGAPGGPVPAGFDSPAPPSNPASGRPRIGSRSP